MPCRADLFGSNKQAFRQRLRRWYRSEGRHDLPWRATRDPYAILVSEFMLQQTQVATVIPYYQRWLRRFPDFASVARASENDVLHAWEGLGYYSRARNLHAAARLVVDRWRGQLPADAAAIATLPGVGIYTANAVATFAFDQSLPIVEANIARVLARLHDFRVPIDTAHGRSALWLFANELLPARSARSYNSALMDLGALICTARDPKCPLCPVQKFCRARQPALLPVKTPRCKTVRLSQHHGFHRSRGRILLERASRPWRGLWILPSMSAPPPERSALYRAEFPFTHHRVTLSVFATPAPSLGKTQRWFRIGDLPDIPMPSPHRRALTHLLSPTAKRC